MKNYSNLIKSKANRTLTATGNKFVWGCIEILAMQNDTNAYDGSIKEQKDKLYDLLHSLIIDEEKSIEEIKEMIKNRKVTERIEAV